MRTRWAIFMSKVRDNSAPKIILGAYWGVRDRSPFLAKSVLSKGCKPDNFESHNSLKPSFTNIQGLCSDFVDCESFLGSNSPDILALCEANLDDSINSGNFTVRGYIPLFWMDSTTHMCGLAVWVNKELLFTWNLSLRKLCRFLCFWLALLHSVSYFFFLYRSPSSSLCMVFYSIWSNIDDVLSINPSANVLSLKTLMSIIKTG